MCGPSNTGTLNYYEFRQRENKNYFWIHLFKNIYNRLPITNIGS